MEAIRTTKFKDKFRLSRSQKEANDFAWYKEKIDEYDIEGLSTSNGYGGVSEYRRMKVNCDMYNNIMDMKELAYVCSPFGAEVGELPATMTNRDISSYRIKALIGMELRRPFGYKVLATNSEATTRREQEETDRIREYVLEGILAPIRTTTEQKYQEQLNGQELDAKAKQQIQQQIQQEITAKTPPEVRKYMERDHQDPSEVLGHQIMEYLMKEQDTKNKFSKGWKYSLLTAYDLYYVGIVNNKPILKVVNPIRFKSDKSPDIDYIEDGSWAVAEYRMSPSSVVKCFKLTDSEIDSIYKDYEHYVSNRNLAFFAEDNDQYDEYVDRENTIRVVHVQFKTLRKVGWLKFIDNDGILQTKFLVDENYKLNKEAGDISIEWEWINETCEGYKIGKDIFKNMQPVEGQGKDIDNIYESKLSYHGAVHDDMNSQPTAPMDRIKGFQYYYNIVMYRLELLLASDKGKKILMNINAIPDTAGIDIEKWQYFFESSSFMWYNPNDEGVTQDDVNTVAKVLDLSLASDINKYIELAEYLEQKCGKAIGVTDPVLGQTAPSDSVGNNQQNLIQTSHILEPYFALHNTVKKNVLNSLLNTAKIAYRNSDLKVLNYVLDDMSRHTVNVDISLLDNATLGLFTEDATEAQETKELIRSLTHAAMQNQKIELSDTLAVIKEKGTQEAEEVLKAAEKTRIEREQASAREERQFKAEEAQKVRDFAELEHKWNQSDIVLKEEERRKTVIQAQAMLSVGFNEDKDFDDDGELDIMEIAKSATEANIKIKEENRKSRELDHKINDDSVKNEIAKEQISVQKMQKAKQS